MKPICFILVLALALSGCAKTAASPTIMAYSTPDFGIDEDTMITEIANLGGCTAEGSGFSCPPGSKLHALGCEILYNSIRYAGLKPYPVFQCGSQENLPGFESDWYLVYSEEHRFIGSFTYNGNQFILIKPNTDIQSLFTPIKSANEAFSYAMLFVDHSWPDWFIYVFEEYDMEYSRGRCSIDNRSVKETGDGYVVHSILKTYSIDSGCLTRLYAIDILVKPSGEMSAIEPGPQLMSSRDDCPGPDENPCL